MSYRQVDVNSGISWLTKGWELFVKNPGVWILMALVSVVILIVLAFIPLLGALVASILGTLLFAGMIFAAHELDGGRNIDLNNLFQGFRDSTRLSPLVILGLIALAGALLTLVLGIVFLGGAIGAATVGGATHSGGMALGAMLGGGLLWVLVSLAIKLAVSALLFFAVPRVVFEGGDPIAAAKDSLNAVLANIAPMLVFALIVVVLSFVATLPLGLGWLVLMPVLACATYAAYKDVYLGTAVLPAPATVEPPMPPPPTPPEPPVT